MTAACNSTANNILGSVLQWEGDSCSDTYLQVQNYRIIASSFLKRGTKELCQAYFIPRETVLGSQAVTLHPPAFPHIIVDINYHKISIYPR